MMKLLDVMNTVHESTGIKPGEPIQQMHTMNQTSGRSRPALNPLIINNTSQVIDSQQLLSQLPPNLLNNFAGKNPIIIVNVQNTAQETRANQQFNQYGLNNLETFTTNNFQEPTQRYLTKRRYSTDDVMDCKRFRFDPSVIPHKRSPSLPHLFDFNENNQYQLNEKVDLVSDPDLLNTLNDIVNGSTPSPTTPSLLSPLHFKPHMSVDEMYQMSLAAREKQKDENGRMHETLSRATNALPTVMNEPNQDKKQ